MNKKLSIIDVQPTASKGGLSRRQDKRAAAEEKFNHLWAEDPFRFDSERNCIERERVKLTLNLIRKHCHPLAGKKAVDLGCGSGVLSRKLADEGMLVDAVDISSNALTYLQQQPHETVTPIKDFIPQTKLEDDHYDLVLSTEVIAYLPKEERRLYFAELSRLVKPDGFVVCSTALDINSSDALQLFGDLVETELQPVEWRFCYNAFLIRLKNMVQAPQNFVKGYKDSSYRHEQMKKRNSFSRKWYQMNSSWLLAPLWKGIAFIFRPILSFLENNETFMKAMEKCCRFFKNEDGISEAILIGIRRPLIVPTQEELMAIETKHKKQVWE